MHSFIAIVLIVFLMVASGFALATMHVENSNALIQTKHLVDGPDPWRTGKPDRAQRRRNKRKSK